MGGHGDFLCNLVVELTGKRDIVQIQGLSVAHLLTQVKLSKNQRVMKIITQGLAPDVNKISELSKTITQGLAPFVNKINGLEKVLIYATLSKGIIHLAGFESVVGY